MDKEVSVNPDDVTQIDGDVAGQLHENFAGSYCVIGCFNFCHGRIGHTKQHVSDITSCKNPAETKGGSTIVCKQDRDFRKF